MSALLQLLYTTFRVAGHGLVLALLALLLAIPGGAQADEPPPLRDLCPPVGIQPRPVQFEPGGIILTSFDRSALWVYNIERNSRYPLPETAPCGTNCHLSRDARWITYLIDVPARIYGKMRLDGTERTPIARDATEVQWWDEETLLIWTPNHKAYLRVDGSTEQEQLDVTGITSIQPGGRWALMLQRDEDDFLRVLINMQTRNISWRDDDRITLDVDTPFFNAAAWSPGGEWLAFVSPADYDASAGITGGEVFAIQPGSSAQPVRWTHLFRDYGAVRINGHAPGSLSWSPDGTRLAFWVIELTGPNLEANTGHAVIHVLNVATGAITVYCGYSTNEHTPNPPRLIWSPDGTHLAFGGRVQGDTRGYLLLALDLETGVFTELSVGIFPALGTGDVVAWGLPPR